ncbi:MULTISPECIES: hypothetical protein [unclassified Micromonospora]|uniref:hypothetical protein n=1 Tax=unclassified Micromonospora TaxID=2617518 RepID=UPI002FEF39A5
MLQAATRTASPAFVIVWAVFACLIGVIWISCGIVELRDREARRPSSLPRWLRSSPWLANPRLMIFVGCAAVAVAVVVALVGLLSASAE